MSSSSCKINADYKFFQMAEPRAKSLVTYSSTSHHFRPRHRSQNPPYGPIHMSSCWFRKNQYLQTLKRTNRNRLVVYSSVQPGGVPPPPPPSGPPSSSWKGWLLAIVFTVVLPLVTTKWGPFLKLIKGEFRTAVEKAEDVMSTVEKVAEEVEEVAEEVADKLPEGGELKTFVTSVEKVAEVADKEAHLAGDFVAKVEQTEVKVESVVDSAINEGKKAKAQK